LNVSFELAVGDARIPVFLYNWKEGGEELYIGYFGDFAKEDGENQAQWESRIRMMAGLKNDEPPQAFFQGLDSPCSVCGKADAGNRLYLRPSTRSLAALCLAHVQPGDLELKVKGVEIERDRSPKEVAMETTGANHLQIIKLHHQVQSQRQIAAELNLAQSTVGYHIKQHKNQVCDCFRKD
jgi:hypothetical protein